jgi:hypothetical protein
MREQWVLSMPYCVGGCRPVVPAYLNDLERRTTTADEYEVLMSAALLRKLLLDGTRLTDQVNRRHRLDESTTVGV